MSAFPTATAPNTEPTGGRAWAIAALALTIPSWAMVAHTVVRGVQIASTQYESGLACRDAHWNFVTLPLAYGFLTAALAIPPLVFGIIAATKKQVVLGGVSVVVAIAPPVVIFITYYVVNTSYTC